MRRRFGFGPQQWVTDPFGEIKGQSQKISHSSVGFCEIPSVFFGWYDVCVIRMNPLVIVRLRESSKSGE
jgi:hypothetical protein